MRTSIMAVLATNALWIASCEGSSPASIDAFDPGFEEVATTDVAEGSSDSISIDSPDIPDTMDTSSESITPPPKVMAAISVSESVDASTKKPYCWASVNNRPSMEYFVSTEQLRIGACAFVAPVFPPPVCDPPCKSGQFCSENATCRTVPEPLDLGTVTVEGLKVAVSMSPQTRYLYYTTTFTPAQPEDGELFDTGTILTAKSSGGALGKFSVQTRGVAPVEADLPCKLPLAAGQSLSVKWKAGVPDDDVRFVMQSGNHGEQFSRIECDSKDTGEIAVDGKLIDAYLKEWRPLESWRLLRHATGYSDTPGGRVEFVATGTIGCMYTLQ